MTTRWRPAFEAIDPKNPTRRWLVGIKPAFFEKLRHSGSSKKFAQLVQVRDVLEDCTDRIYEGWSRPEKIDGYFVYVGIPAEANISPTITVSGSHEGKVFLVFIAPDGTIVDWCWRSLQPGGDDDLRPENIDGALIWSRETT